MGRSVRLRAARTSAPLFAVLALAACLAEPWDPGEGPDAGLPRYHPAGFDDPAVHGPLLKRQVEDCRTCHGQDLTLAGGPGGPALGCNTHHMPSWRTNCTFCHGGIRNLTGAPPRDLSGTIVPAELSFRAHTAHVRDDHPHHAPFACTECHPSPSPVDVLSPGHVFDGTPGRAEVSFAAGRSPAGTYAGEGRCANLYCHGTGTSTGARAATDDLAPPTCTSCHAGQDSPAEALGTMSGQHRRHVAKGVRCAECHAGAVDARGAVVPARHVDGVAEVAFEAEGFARTAAGCTGRCHDQEHAGRTW